MKDTIIACNSGLNKLTILFYFIYRKQCLTLGLNLSSWVFLQTDSSRPQTLDLYNLHIGVGHKNISLN